MPYAIPDGGIIECTFRGTVLNQEMLTVTHWQLDTSGGISDGRLFLEAFCEHIKPAGALHGQFMACCCNLYVGGRIKLQWILPQRYAAMEFVPTFTTGQIIGQLVAPNVAIAINKQSENAGPHARGVTHMPAVPADFVTDGSLNGAGFGEYNALGTLLKTDIAVLAGNTHPVIYNRSTPGDSQVIINCNVSEKLRTMHRRTVGLGS